MYIFFVTFRCDGCNMFPLRGIRYKCGTCRDFDYCENCMMGYGDPDHPKWHDFQIIDTPGKSINQSEHK